MVSIHDSVMDEISLHEENTMEFRVMMAYAQRTLPASKYQRLIKKPTEQGNGKDNQDTGNVQTPKKEKKKKKSLRKWLTPKCIRAQRDKEDMCRSPCADSPDTDPTSAIVQRVEVIIQEITKRDQEQGFRMVRQISSIQYDGDDVEELIANIVQILRSSGDEVNDKMLQEQTFLERLQGAWSYSFFRRVTDCFLTDMVPASEPEYEQQSSKIALCLHATTKLTTLDNHPMNRVLGFGVQYLKENYTPWIQSKGGWEKVMGIPEEEEVE